MSDRIQLRKGKAVSFARDEGVIDLSSTHVLHVITSLGVGGAEMMLAKLIEAGGKGQEGPTNEVISLVEPETVGERIRSAGTRVHSLGMKRGRPGVLPVLELRRKLATIKPDVIVAWMHHAQIVLSAATAFSRREHAVIWNVRHSLADIRNESLMTRLVLAGCARLSGKPDAIIYNAKAAVSQYERIGFSPDKAVVIPNGFDCSRFAPDPIGREAIRRRHQIDDGAFLIGLLARSHPMKDVGTLIDAVHKVRATGADVHLLLAGRGMDSPTPEIAQALAEIPPHRLTVLGERSDIPDLLAGLDLLALPSAWGEGFPNILGEALASGVPCVTTDVGDSAWVVGDVGQVVAPRDVDGLAQAICRMASLDPSERQTLSEQGRSRVLSLFEIGAVTRRYRALYASVLGRRHHDNHSEALVSLRGAA